MRQSANRRRVRTGERGRLTGLDDAGRLGAVAGARAGGNAETCNRDAGNQGDNDDLEMRAAVCAVDRVVHGGLLPSTRLLVAWRCSPGRFPADGVRVENCFVEAEICFVA